jgi:hypothetical protein
LIIARGLDLAVFAGSIRLMKLNVLSLLIIVLSVTAEQSLAQSRPGPLQSPEISRELESLPPQVRRMRGLILEAIRSGDILRLKQPIETNELPPSFSRQSGPVSRAQSGGPAMANELMKLFAERSGDGKGRETMGQLVNALAVGYARINAGTPQEMYVWPYLAVIDPRILTPEQEVDAYRLFSAYTLREWREKSRYPGWRIGIGPDGTWHYLHGAQ